MGFQGGDIIDITYNHPTVGEGTFFMKAGEDSTFDSGGFRNEDDDDMVAGNGQAIWKKNRKRWSIEGPIAWDMNDQNELDKLTQLHESPVEADWTISHVNGTVWAGRGLPVGDVKGATQDVNIPLKVSGGGNLEKIVG